MFDSHVHLNSPKMLDEVAEYIDRANTNGVTRFLVVGYDLGSSQVAIDLAHQYDGVYAAVGIHPTDSLDLGDEHFNQLERMLEDEKVVAIGEIGLDYYWDNVPKDQQYDSFKRQMNIAKKHQKPIIIHCRDAMQDTLDLIKEADMHQGVFHCFSGSVESAKMVLDLGFYVSLAGPVTFKNAKVPKEVATFVPLDRLLIETDSPYLAPDPFRGKANEPAYVAYVAKEIANLRGITSQEVGQITMNNANRLFKIN